MKDILILIGVIIGFLMALAFVLGTVWLLFFSMVLGNSIATFLIMCLSVLLFINIGIYIKEEIFDE